MTDRKDGAAPAERAGALSNDHQKAAAAYAAAASAAPASELDLEPDALAQAGTGQPASQTGSAPQPPDSGEPAAPGDLDAGDPDAGAEPEPGDAAEHEQNVVRDLEELTARAEKADEYLELAQRTRADFDNYRKRAERKVVEAQDRGIAKLAKELLPAIDNLDRAVQATDAFAGGSPEEPAAEVESQLASGIKLVHADVLAALARVGIEPFSPAGEPFDPQLHEAVVHQPVEGAQSGTVIEVYQSGYRLGDLVLRPARVGVAA